jgi:hypothetical protein
MVSPETRQKYLASLRPHERNVYLACAHLVAEGVWPGPRALVNVLHGHDGHNLNGREARVRRVFFEHHGFIRRLNGRWYLPGKPLWRRYMGSTPYRSIASETLLT